MSSCSNSISPACLSPLPSNWLVDGLHSAFTCWFVSQFHTLRLTYSCTWCEERQVDHHKHEHIHLYLLSFANFAWMKAYYAMWCVSLKDHETLTWAPECSFDWKQVQLHRHRTQLLLTHPTRQHTWNPRRNNEYGNDFAFSHFQSRRVCKNGYFLQIYQCSLKRVRFDCLRYCSRIRIVTLQGGCLAQLQPQQFWAGCSVGFFWCRGSVLWCHMKKRLRRLKFLA